LVPETHFPNWTGLHSELDEPIPFRGSQSTDHDQRGISDHHHPGISDHHRPESAQTNRFLFC
jgi:hypothetical protein